MRRTGLLINPHSRRNRRRPSGVEALVEIAPDADLVHVTSSAAEVPAAVGALLEAGIDMLAISGGDGTNHAAVTAMKRAMGDAGELPELALLRGGTMNTVANGLGIVGRPETLLRAALDRPEGSGVMEVGLMRADIDGSSHWGFMFGLGVVVRFLEEYYRAPDPSPAHAAATLTRCVASVVTNGELGRRLVRRQSLRVTADGAPFFDGEASGLVCGTVPELGLGFQLFARCNERAESFHALMTAGTPLKVVAALPRVYRGVHRDMPALPDSVVGRLEVEAQEPLPWMMDGDIHPGVEGRLSVNWGGSVRIFRPPPRSHLSATVDRVLSR